MKYLPIIAALTAIFSLLIGFIDLVVRLFGREQVFNRKVFYVLLCLGTLALSFYLGSRTGSGYIPNDARVKELQDRISYLDRTIDLLNHQIKEDQNQILTSEKSIDFLKGIIDKLNEKIDQYDDKFRVPRKARIILFEHINYKGHRCYLTVDDDALDLNLYDFGNRVSSIKIEGGAQARVYSGINYNGSSWLVESDMPSLLDNNWNDRILSVSVERKERH